MNFSEANLDKKCRICAADIFDGTSGISIFNDIYLEEKIRKYLYITISQSDELPKTICGSCFIKLEGIHRFACLALKTEENFLTYLSRKKFNEERKQERELTDQTTTTATTTTILPQAIEKPLLAPTKTSNRKISIRPYKAPKLRNSRHVDHITLEQIINDKIAKNFRSQTCELIPIKPKNMQFFGYDDLKIGQFIKDHELLKLILKALKWNCDRSTIDYQVEKLKNTSFRDLLSDQNLLRDADLVQLIKSYVGHETFSSIHNSLKSRDIDITKTSGLSSTEAMDLSVILLKEEEEMIDDENITRMEVRVDPELFLPEEYDENEMRHKQLERNEQITVHPVIPSKSSYNKIANFICTICSDKFTSNVQLEEHIVTHLLKSKKQLASQRYKFPT